MGLKGWRPGFPGLFHDLVSCVSLSLGLVTSLSSTVVSDDEGGSILIQHSKEEAGKERGRDTCSWLQFWVYTALSLFTHFWASVSAAIKWPCGFRPSLRISQLFIAVDHIVWQDLVHTECISHFGGEAPGKIIGPLTCTVLFQIASWIWIWYYLKCNFSHLSYFHEQFLLESDAFFLLAEIQCDIPKFCLTQCGFVPSLLGDMLSSYPLGLLNLALTLWCLIELCGFATSIPTY